MLQIYLLNATLNGKLLSEILCRRLGIKGMITLDENGKIKTNEYYDYTEFCKNNRIDCIKLKSYNMSDLNDKRLLEDLDIDLLIVASWQRLVPEWLISKCKIGIIGAHGSHEGIERGRGRSPQNWALLAGKNQFILSIFWIEPETDNGRVIDTVEFEYDAYDTILSSYVKINLFKASMIIKNIENGRILRKEGIPQSDEAFFLPKRTAEDGQIDWNRDAIDINNMIRALTKPYPGAYTVYNGVKYLIWIARPIRITTDLYEEYSNGTLLSILGDSLLIKCKYNLLLVDAWEEANQGQNEIHAGIVFESADYQKQIERIIRRHNEQYGTPLSTLVLDEINPHKIH